MVVGIEGRFRESIRARFVYYKSAKERKGKNQVCDDALWSYDR
jgi:hypothetical protein